MAQPSQVIYHLAYTVIRSLQVLFVHDEHVRQVLSAFFYRLVVVTASAQTQQLAPAGYAQFTLIAFDQAS